MAKGRAGRQRQLTKAVNPNFAAMAQSQGGKGGRGALEPQVRPFALMDAINTATGQYGEFAALPRDAYDDTAFGPLTPLRPDPIDPLGQDGRTEPRAFEYPVGWNLPGNGNRPVPWAVLRQAAAGVGIIRRCIEVRKKHVRDLSFTFAPTEQAIEDAYLADASRSKGKMDVERELREKYGADIKRLRAYWAKPWAANDWSFGQWVNAVLEDYLTLDAVAIYPKMSYGGDVLGLEVIDATTIKPLLSSRGTRPDSPHPAFQQMLYGFPRGEWAASITQDAEGNAVIENAFAASELYYYRENVRTFTPYGFSATEQALYDSRLYLKRQQWMLAEYDDGSTPLTFLETSESKDGSRLSLTQRRQYEQALNAEYSGNTGARMRLKVLPNGWKAQQLAGIDERYKPEYDLHLIKLLCSFFGVPIAELGFTEPTGLGNNSWHEGQADVSGRLGKRPDTAVIGDIINGLSAQFLRMPPEICGHFADPAAQSDLESIQISKELISSGQSPINEQRAARGESALPFAEANMPFVLGGPNGIIFLDGAKASIDAAIQQAQLQAESTALGTAGKLELEGRKLEDGAAARQEQRDFQREEREATQEFTKETADTTKGAEPDYPDVPQWLVSAQHGMMTALQDQRDEFEAFCNWRRRQGNAPRRPFVFKHCLPDWIGEREKWYDPTWVAFEGYEWIEFTDLEKATWADWNVKNPTHPRGPNGRFVKVVGNLVGALQDEALRERAQRMASAGNAPTAEHMRQARIDALRETGERGAREYEAAVGSADPERIAGLDATDARLREAGLRLFGMPETVGATDRKRMRFLSDASSAETGQALFVRPGVLWTDEQGTEHVLSPAMAEHYTPDMDPSGFWAKEGFDAPGLMAERERQWAGTGRVNDESSTLAPVTEDRKPTNPPTMTDRFGNEWTHTGKGNVYAFGEFEKARIDLERAYIPEHIRDVEKWLATGKSILPVSMLLGGVSRASFATSFSTDDRARMLAKLREILPGMREDARDRPGVERAIADLESLTPEAVRAKAAMDQARAGIAAARLAKLGTVQKDILRTLGRNQRVPEGTRGAKGMGSLLQLSERKDYYELSDLGREALRQLSTPAGRGTFVTSAPEPPKVPKREGKAKRGDLLVAEQRHPDMWRAKPGGGRTEPTAEYPVFEITSVTREGKPRMVRNVQWGTAELPVGHHLGLDMSRSQVIPGDQVHKESLIEALRQRTYPNSDTPLAHDNLSELRTVILEHVVTKAAAPEPPGFEQEPTAGSADADPKGQVPPDQRWPGWAQDLAIAAAAAPMLLAAMRGLTTSALLISALRQFLSGGLGDVPAPTVAAVQSVLRAYPGLLEEVVAAITPPIRQVHTEGALVGERSAAALVEHVQAAEGNDARDAVSFALDWGNWEPGHPEAARLLLRPGGLEELTAQSNVIIRGIAANRLDRLGQIIGQGLTKGHAPATIGRAIADEFGNEKWAHMVALTETNRAMSAVSVNEYRAAGMKYKGWMTALDQRVCKICANNERNPDGTPRIVPIGENFPSGDPWPPGHPRCRCAPIPVIRFGRTMSSVIG